MAPVPARIQFGMVRYHALVVFAPMYGTEKFDRGKIEGVEAMLKEHNRLPILCEYLLPPSFHRSMKTLAKREFVLNALRGKIYREVWVFGESVTEHVRELVQVAYDSEAALADRTTEDSLINRYIKLFWNERWYARARKSA